MVNLKYPIEASVDAVVQVMVILSWTKVSCRQLLKKEGAFALGALSMNLFLPLLMFTTLIDDISTSDMKAFGQVLLFTTSTSHSVHVVIGCTLGFIIGWVLRCKPGVRKMIAVSVGEG